MAFFYIKRVAAAVLFLFIAAIMITTSARGQIYVASNYGNSVGSYNLDGTPINASLINSLPAGEGADYLAVSGGTIFVSNAADLNGSIGEYTTAGATVNAALIAPLSYPEHMTVSGSNLFIAQSGYYADGVLGSVSEYSTTGTPVNTALISGLDTPTDVKVSGSNLFVLSYIPGTANGVIGEYTTSGGTVNSSLIQGVAYPVAIAVSSTDVFVVTTQGILSEYTTAGTFVNQVQLAGIGVGSSAAISDIAISGSDLFIASGNYDTNIGTVTEYTTSGTLLNASLITGLSNAALSIDVGGTTVPEPATTGLMCAGGVALLLRRRKTGAASPV